MATQDNPLLSLAPEKQQQLVDLVESNDIESLATKTGLTRRQILGIGATLAGSGALGGYAVSELVDPAQAQADTGDSDGNVGLPTDRVDVFADGVDSNSLSTDDLNIAGADFISSGSFLPILTNQVNGSTSSSTFSDIEGENDNLMSIPDLTEFVPSGATLQIFATGRSIPNGDQVDLKLQDVKSNSWESTFTNISDIFFVSTNVTTPTLPVEASFKFRNSDNSTPVTVKRAIHGFGLQF
jgi:hypothetical protein